MVGQGQKGKQSLANATRDLKLRRAHPCDRTMTRAESRLCFACDILENYLQSTSCAETASSLSMHAMTWRV